MQTGSKKNKSAILIALLLLIIVGLCAYIFLGRGTEKTQQTEQPETTLSMEQNQGEYVKPEQPVDRSKNVTLPGWGGFTIPADTTDITEGFEFHNPEENYWYEDWISIDGKQLEKLVVDSGNQVELEHYLKLAGINDTVASVTDYDKESFQISQTEEGAYTIEGIGGFDGTKTISVETSAGKTVNLDVECKSECYYMTFGLYLEDGDELLYQSDLVAPGNYIQEMKMTRSLEPGTYDAYVVCQPYQSDKVTKTNQGVVKITLTAA